MFIKINLYLIIFVFITTLLSPAVFAEEDKYPLIDISGYKKFEYSSINVEPTRNYYTAKTYLGYVDSSLGGSPWQERLQLRILGKLSEDLSVSYNMQQEPDLPEKYDVKVQYGNTELTFGDFNAVIDGNEFANASKYVNGYMIDTNDPYYKLKFVTAKTKSNTQNWTTQKGNNTRGPYNLGHGSIVEDSEKIELNGTRLKRDVDYAIDYFEGKVTFIKALSPADEIRYTYEFTNLIDLFFPTLSKRDFLGMRAWGKITSDMLTAPAIPPIRYETQEVKQVFPTEFKPKTETIIKRIVVPATGEATKEVVEKLITREVFSAEEARDNAYLIARENTGIYQLKNFPIEPFSEVVRYHGIILQKNVDYAINYNSGALTLIVDEIPNRQYPVSITYRPYITDAKTDQLQGADGVGPYTLQQIPVAVGSEKVYVDGSLYIKDLDYVIDYRAGKITFRGNIPVTSSIKISYRALKEIPRVIVHEEPPHSIALGVNYLRESAKKSSGGFTVSGIETFRASTITSNNDLVQLSHYPLDRTSPVTVALNGVTLTENVDYAIPITTAVGGQVVVTPPVDRPKINNAQDTSDGYDLGIIYMYKTLTSTDEVAVSYTYQKTIRSGNNTFNGVGNGSVGPYYLSRLYSIVAGSETIRVWDAGTQDIVIYRPNSKIFPDVLTSEVYDGDYSINYSANPPYIIFNNPLDSNKRFSVEFYYVPSGTTDQEDLQHDVLGVDANIKLFHGINLDAVYAHSKTDQSTIYLSEQDTIKGTNTRGPYTLSHNNIVENSEQVFVNNYPKNKDVDYNINYTTGQITFFYLTLTPNDELEVNYNYRSTSGVSAGTKVIEGDALRLGTSAQYGSFTVSSNFKTLDSNFAPMSPTGSIYLSSGSEYRDIAVNYAEGPYALNTSVKYAKQQQGVNEGYFNHSTEFNYSGRAPISNLFSATGSFRRYETADDVLPLTLVNTLEVNKHKIDNLSESYSAGLTMTTINWGAFTFNNNNNVSRTTTYSDTIDRKNPTTNMQSLFKTTNSFSAFGKINGAIDFQISEPLTTGLGTVEENGQIVTKEVETAHSVVTDVSYDFGWDMTFWMIKRLNARARLQEHDDREIIAKVTKSTRNATYRLDFDPLSNLQTNAEYNRQETLSVLINGANPKSENYNFNARFQPFSLMNISWNGAKSNSLQESGNTSYAKSDTTSVAWSPLANLQLAGNFSDQKNNYSNYNGTVETSSSYNTKVIKGYSSKIVNIRPFSYYFRVPFLDSLNAEGTYSKNQEYNDQLNSSLRTITDIHTETRGGTLSLNPLRRLVITAGLSQTDTHTYTGTAETTFAITLNYNYSAAYSDFFGFNIKSTYSHAKTIDMLVSSERPKTTINTHVERPLFNWGSLIYDYGWEDNQGEIRQGVIQNLNNIQEVHTYSFASNLPWNNPIISSIPLKINYKNIIYIDNLDNNNSFTGSLLNFDLTINF